MNYSPYQSAIFDFIQNGEGNAVVEAVAGSGKTTTIVKSLEFVPRIVDKTRLIPVSRDPNVLFVAFNKHIAEELSRRVPHYVTASTLNSVGWSICRQNSRGVKLDVNKDENILRTMFDMKDQDQRKLYYRIKNTVSRLVGLMKALMVDDPDCLNMICDKYDVTVPEIKDFDFFGTVFNVYAESANNIRVMNFDDQIFQPIHQGWSFPHYDWVFGDEIQDWSPVQTELVKRLSERGRMVGVGDRHQSIYGFRGADPEAVPNIIKMFSATVLPLSICYRCPDKVIDEAQKIVAHIESPENNPKGDGTVEWVTTEHFVGGVTDGDYVLCRTTAPLVKRCLGQIRLGKRATVKGRDIGQGLKTLLNSIAPDAFTSIPEFLDLLKQYQAKQLEKLRKAGREQEAQNVEDRCDTLDALAVDCDDVYQIECRIDTIFSDNATDGIIFCTGHRSKGLEANRIWFLRPDLCPHPKAIGEWQEVQENNLRYVMVTRAMAELYYVRKDRDEK